MRRHADLQWYRGHLLPMRAAVAVTTVALLVAAPHAAHARKAQRPSTTTTLVWYGDETFAADGVGVTLFALGIGTAYLIDDPTPIVLGLGTLAFGGASVHYQHGHHGKAALSAVVRTGALAGALVILDRGSDDHISDRDATLHYFLPAMGLLVAGSLFDALVLGWEPGEETDDWGPWTPVATPTSEGMTFGLAGTF
jgi:hypothetical protein